MLTDSNYDSLFHLFRQVFFSLSSSVLSALFDQFPVVIAVRERRAAQCREKEKVDDNFGDPLMFDLVMKESRLQAGLMWCGGIG